MGISGDPVLDLQDVRARDVSIAGAKAAALARATAEGLQVLPGFVVTTDAGDIGARVRAAWETISDRGRVQLVVRSSSTVEDVTASSMAGRFESFTDVRGWEAFVRAVAAVRASASSVPGGPAPMGVLVQPALEAERGGVMFGLDPVTGDRRRIVVECSPGTPKDIVSGQVTASRYVLSRRGRVLAHDDGGTPLRARDRRALARLAAKASDVFGGPQDVEWAIDAGGVLWLLQSRPVTAVGEAWKATGPFLGPGPVGETFPAPLRRLERDLFLAPMRAGVIEALGAIGVVPQRRIERSPVVTSVGGRAAADLELLGWVRARRGWGVLNPLPPARRLLAAWHVGRLRRALPRFATDRIDVADRYLASVPSFDRLPDAALLTTLARVREELIRVHAFQILAGMLLPSADDRPGASTLALSALARGRDRGRSDAQIVATAPVVLTLTPPRVGTGQPLPASAVDRAGSALDLGMLDPREGLRLRARWLDELAARISWELGRRLVVSGRLSDPELVAELTLAELDDQVAGVDRGIVLSERPPEGPGPPLPATFQLTPSGEVVPVSPPRAKRGVISGEGRGAGGGRGVGPVRHEGGDVGPGDVLVVRFLSPSLAGELPNLSGLVSETGSTLSHLAILAREVGVPTVVGKHGAVDRYPEGTAIVVDGETGDVQPLEPSGEEVPS